MSPQKKQEIKEKLKSADNAWNANKDKIFFVMLSILITLAGKTYYKVEEGQVINAVQSENIKDLYTRVNDNKKDIRELQLYVYSNKQTVSLQDQTQQ